MPLELSPIELRVIACLIEKQVTTPEQYPLSLNALQNACNQKSNRDPVMELSEGEVQATLDSLTRRHLLLERSGFGSRVPKYQQRLCNTEFSTLQLSAQERAVLCELMLRGPQTAGELRTRAARMAAFADATEVESTLEGLIRRTDGALVARLAREPGRRELRYRHLLGAASAQELPSAPPEQSELSGVAATPVPLSAAAVAPPLESRLSALERTVARLAAQLEELRRR
ncbi:MAG TPA: DUF480 domain-containing protein [Steroidobacteraceae bacterium]|jgi:hypothetical protein|nr:DUF480 domain-containing protein [Steroidobacteraceae bacterium]